MLPQCITYRVIMALWLHGRPTALRDMHGFHSPPLPFTAFTRSLAIIWGPESSCRHYVSDTSTLAIVNPRQKLVGNL